MSISTALRTWVRRVHLWLGLSFGALFVLAGLTGSVLVFYPEFDALLHPEIRVAGNGQPVDWDRALQTVRQTYPDKAGPWRFEVTTDGGAIPARYYNPPETAGRAFAPMMVWLSPDGGQVIRRDYWGDYAMTFLYDLHYRLLLGPLGGTIMGYIGIGIFVLLALGVWAWWPRGRQFGKALHFKPNAVPVRRLHDWHKLTGVWGAVLMLIFTISGVMLAFPQTTDTVLTAVVSPVDSTPSPPLRDVQGADPITPMHAVAAARAHLPEARLAWVETPRGRTGTYRIRFQQPEDPSIRFPHSFVWVDQYSGEVVAAVDSRNASAATTISNWLHPFHDGSVGGMTTRVISFVVGLLPLVLFITGFRRWRVRQSRLEQVAYA